MGPRHSAHPVPGLSNAELVQLRVRVIALENMVIALLADTSALQLSHVPESSRTTRRPCAGGRNLRSTGCAFERLGNRGTSSLRYFCIVKVASSRASASRRQPISQVSAIATQGLALALRHAATLSARTPPRRRGSWRVRNIAT
ncbi:MAG: hypothetical protein DCF31_12625 [Alphaproteobacteria bacterium]|nr:MAG: hypothetical protein DCF31_12625 [Alphaproteobacteria bacterium]